ncbi:4Fe-4S dicluster domain-containing protein [Bdellovibrionota bacterium FG-2]
MIPKIVSTPLKWASKQLLNRTLLQFPKGEVHPDIACVYCPEMCRFACPTAVASGNDAVTPSNKMALLYKEKRWPGRGFSGAEPWPIFDCTGCGRCAEYCKYEMPVADRLFEARAQYSWSGVERVLPQIEKLDRVGDLLDELGLKEQSTRKRQAFVAGAQSVIVEEPREQSFLKQSGVQAELRYEAVFREENFSALLKKCEGKRWLVHESVWLSRRLSRFAEVADWVERAQRAGVQLVLPFAHGRDCIDCGGEGAFRYLHPEQAKTMAKDFWGRDRHRVDGVLCMSQRCAEHFKQSLGGDVSVVSLGEN